MDIQRIYHRLGLMLGENEFEQELIFMVCENAKDEILRKVKVGVSLNDERLIFAAAGVAYYNLALIKCARDEGEVSFQAGEVSVTRNQSSYLKSALLIRENCLASAKEVISDDYFEFRQVR